MNRQTYPGITCPNCGSGFVAHYLWGEPTFNEQLERKLNEGRIVLGGCCITKSSPEWRCNACGCDFGRDPSIYAAWLSKRFNQLKAVVYGAAVGDALGVPYEFRNRGTFECKGMSEGGAHNVPKGTFSDDTSLLLATQDSIRTCGKIDVEDMRARFCLWLHDGRYTADDHVFDVGNTTAIALNAGHGCDGEQDNGNGSLMRIAPLAFTCATDDKIREVSAITHAHEISKEACVLFVHVLRATMESGRYSLADVLETRIPKDERFRFLLDIASWPREKVKSGGYVLDTLGAALWCLQNSHDYKECVLEAVNLGSDTDTTACVAGALAGALYGFQDIPVEWLADLRGKSVIEESLGRR